MGELARIGVSLESDLLHQFDDLIKQKGYDNRSEAIRDLIRDRLLGAQIDQNRVVVGTLTIVYDHHRPNLTEKLVEAQHQFGEKVLSAMHVHLDHHNCLEVVVIKGRSREVRDFANGILSLRGVNHGQLVVTSAGAQ
ncbi:MAG TPA: nickel-responsive transcriptional regulator NikR [Terriglobia bacterium]|nr:nickel-responsive transcriptional regulator NikR [Terriglobia bacterium]